MEIILKGHENHGTREIRGDFNCDACDDRSYGNNIICNNCNIALHKKCTFVLSLPEVLDHPSHDGHYIYLLITGAPDYSDPKCHICGKYTKRLLYHCGRCNLNLDIGCMLNGLSARASINMPWHHHPLVKLDLGYQMLCEVCGRSDGHGYFCPLPTCKLMVHEKCVSVFDKPPITHPLHVKHSLKLLTNGGPSYTDSKCHVCEKHIENFLYHCDICKFNLDMACAIDNHDQHTLPPLVLSNLKVYEHTLSLFPRLVSFDCDACGTKGDRSPYVSLQGDYLFFHQKCVQLPRVIHVNRHDHRVSYKSPLGLGEWKCEICLEVIDWSCGAYSCSLCPSYVLHSTCATRKDVWDGKELDGIPEEVLDSEPFKLNDDNTITHFAHEQHNMTLNKEGIALGESILCEGCVRPIASDTFYKCSVCNFLLHETCANLPKTKRHFLSPGRLSLRLISGEDYVKNCSACDQCFTNGFVYTNGDENFDLICCSITVPFIHESHEHPLLDLGVEYQKNSCHNCVNRKLEAKVLGCTKCNYYLDIGCATLPLSVSLHNYDEHPLILCYGEEASGKYWCDICERKINTKKWFYTCNDCCVTLHIFCVLGDLIRYPKPGKFTDTTQLMFNNTSSRAICNDCNCRCLGPYYFFKMEKSFCSYFCLLRASRGDSNSLNEYFRCPPWIDELKS